MEFANICNLLRKTGGCNGIFLYNDKSFRVRFVRTPMRPIRHAVVSAGVVLMKNVPPYKAVLVKQELDVVDWSPEIYDR